MGGLLKTSRSIPFWIQWSAAKVFTITGQQEIVNTTTNQALFINQDGNGTALHIDSEATTANVLFIDAQNTDGSVVRIVNNGAQVNGGRVVTIIQENATSSDDVLQIRNDGTGQGLLINQDGAGTALNIDTEALAADAINIDAINTSGTIVDINLVPGVASSASIMSLANDSNTTGDCIGIVNNGTGAGININQVGVQATGKRALVVQSNAAQVNTELVLMIQDNASSDKPILVLNNDGTGTALFISQDGLAEAALLDMGTHDKGFIDFVATADGDATSALSTFTTSGATTHHIQISINGASAWIAASTTDPTA